MEENNGHTSGFDFEAYRLGTMDVAEQHSFEKAMLDNPLLADAYEGYLDQVILGIETGAPSSELKALLDARIRPGRSETPLWYYVAAASILLLIGFFVGLGGLNKETEKADLAVVQSQDSLRKGPKTMIADSFSSTEPSVASAESFEKQPSQLTDIPKSEVSTKQRKSFELKEQALAAVEQEQTVVSSVSNDSIKPFVNLTEALASQAKGVGTERIAPAPQAFSSSVTMADRARKRVEEMIEGTVVDETGHALPGVSVQNKSGRGTVTDASGHYSIEAGQGDSLSFAYVGFKPATINIAAAQNVQLKEDFQALSEVVVVGYGKAKKTDMSATVGEPGPKGGWVSYRHYLAQQANMLGLKEQVVVRFKLNRNGRPVDLVTDKQGEAGEIAKRIVVDGARWNRDNNKKELSVTVPAGQ